MATLHIKNMVCDRCIMVVENLLRGEGYNPVSVDLGRAVVADELWDIRTDRLGWKLRELGFDLVSDPDDQLIEMIRGKLIAYMHALETGSEHRKMSAFLSDELNTGYQTLTRTWSEQTGDTIEKAFIRLRIERVKELLSYGEMSLSQIAAKMGYSSVQHLSTQFRKHSGQTVRAFRRELAEGLPVRKSLDEV